MDKTKLAQVIQKTKQENKGFSLPSVIIGSVIAAVLGAVALNNMWGSVDRANISAEATTITNLKTGAAGILEENGSFPSSLNNTLDTTIAGIVDQVPSDLKYQFVLMGGPTTAYSDNWIGLKAYAFDTKGQDKLNTIVEELDLKYDGAAGAGAGKFVYKTDCSAPATPATSQTDCFYLTPLLAKGSMPNSITLSEKLADGPGTQVNTDLTTTVANQDWITDLNLN